MPGVQGHRQGRNEESCVTRPVLIQPELLRIEQRELEAARLS